MTLPKNQFETWLRRHLFLSEERCRKIIIRHGTATSRLGQILFAIDVPTEIDESNNWNDWITEVINEIDNTAQADADGSSAGVEKYVIQVLHGDDIKPSASFNIRMAGESSPEDDGILSEPATKTGLLSQTMRHLEAVMRSNTMVNAHALTQFQKTISRQETMIEKLVEEKFNSIGVVEELLSQKQERDLEAAKVGQKMELQEKLFDKGMLLLPTIVNKVAGGNGQKLLPEHTTPLEQQISSLMGTITEEQLNQLKTVFTTEQLVVLLDMFNNVGEKQEQLTKKQE
jgi:hypothetical protein